MRIEDKNVEPDTLSWIKFSAMNWTHDSKGFFYSRYPAPKDGEVVDAGTETNANLYNELYYHFLGTNQSEDILCWRDPENPQYRFHRFLTDDGKYLMVHIGDRCDPINKLYYCDLSKLPSGLESFRNENSLLPIIKLIDKFDAKYDVVANDGTVILLCQIIFQVMQMGSNYWISWATEQKGRVSNGRLMGTFALLSGGSSIFILGRTVLMAAVARTVLMAAVAVETAQRLFRGMITSVFRAPVSFFDTTPSSRILSRSSTDQSTVSVLFKFQPFLLEGTNLASLFRINFRGYHNPLFQSRENVLDQGYGINR